MSEAAIIRARGIALIMNHAIETGAVILNGPSTISQMQDAIVSLVQNDLAENQRLREANEKLTTERDQARKAILAHGKGSDFDWNVLGRIDELERVNAKLLAALSPFAKFACDEPHVDEPMCQNCVARSAISEALAANGGGA